MPATSRPRRPSFIRSSLSLLVALGVVAAAGQARAQSLGLAADRFDPAPAGDYFFGVQRPTVDGKLRLSGAAIVDYAHKPLVLRDGDGNTVGSIIRRRYTLNATVALAIVDRLLIHATLPATLDQEGDSPRTGTTVFPSPSTSTAGDFRFGARLRLVGENDSPFQLAIAGSYWAPTGNQDGYTSDGRSRVSPSLVLGGLINDFLVWNVDAGLMFRRAHELLTTPSGNELTFGAGVGVLAANKTVFIGPEVYGSTVINNGASAFHKSTTNAEALFGVRWRPSPFVLGVGAGPGLTTGVGTPDFRIVGIIGLAAWGKEAPPPPPPSDRDGDGVLDTADACPDIPGVRTDDPKTNGCPVAAPGDKDGDGIIDDKDACIDVPGVKSDDPKKNGCPPDKDGDGITDDKDACPDVPGVANEDPKKNGCPPDKDGDGIPDDKDACPDVPGVASDDPKKNGCPADTDGDGIPDAQDACPNDPGPADPDPKKNGCPLVKLTAKAIEITEQIHFEFNKARILPDSDKLLTAIADVMKGHLELKKISIEGHTDNKGAAAYNQKLSQQRADSVMKWLTDHGIDKSRLVAKGFGMTKPIADNKTDEGREANRRVEFRIAEKTEEAPK